MSHIVNVNFPTSGSQTQTIETMTDKDRIDELVVNFNRLKKEISKVIVGQDDVVDQVCISVFSRAHCLLVCPWIG